MRGNLVEDGVHRLTDKLLRRQFGFRFSLDYTPYLLLLFALGGWPLRHRAVVVALVLGGLVNFWGAVAFRGYTELVRNW